MSDPIERLNEALKGLYAIEGELGEGGMATVYLADDLKHERKVAVKVLKPDLAAVVGGERFLAEIKTTANLQHPHILPLFDSGQADGFLYYVMPYVEGETLGDRITRERQLPVDEALGIATAVANALQTAHEQGVIHRDIKPANILLSRGEPLVADFGIALAVGAAGGGRLTETGLSVGTPFYMSPEQATGDQPVGVASDTYALACVLYEMLVGEPPYLGNTAQAVLGKIIQGVPVSATSVRKSIPANVDAAIRKALEKTPADRFPDVRSFAQALADPTFRYGEDETVLAQARSGPWKWWSVATTVTTVALAAVLAWSLTRPAPPRPVERFGAPFLPGQEPTFTGNAGYDLSPDGTMLVYRRRMTGEDNQILMVRRWDDLTATPVRESTDGTRPAISPDGLELAFQVQGQIKVLALAGGPVRPLMDGESPEWGPNGYVYAIGDSGAVRVPAIGGSVEQLTRLAEGERRHWVSDVLPGGEWALLEVEDEEGGPDQIRVLNLTNGDMRPLVEGEQPRYAPSGHLVYSATDGSTMMAALFDAGEAELLGPPVAVMEVATWSLSDGGKLFYTVGGGSNFVGRDLVWVDRSGIETPVGLEWIGGPTAVHGWSISPDGSAIAIRHFAQEDWDIWVKRLSGPFSRLTFDEASDRQPAWHPGGETIAFLSDRGGNNDVWSRRADGTGEPELILDLGEDIFSVEWTPDGEYMLLEIASNAADVIAVPVGADGERIPIATSSFIEEGPAVSPDRRWIAYASGETGEPQIYVHPFPAIDSGRWQVSSNGGRNPRWAHDGEELFFEGPAPDRALMVADVQGEPTFQASTPRALFATSPNYYGSNTVGQIYRVAPDDERFLFARATTTSGEEVEGAPSTVLVNNFFEVLEQMVGR